MRGDWKGGDWKLGDAFWLLAAPPGPPMGTPLRCLADSTVALRTGWTCAPGWKIGAFKGRVDVALKDGAVALGGVGPVAEAGELALGYDLRSVIIRCRRGSAAPVPLAADAEVGFVAAAAGVVDWPDGGLPLPR